jgi:hypothetical protein
MDKKKAYLFCKFLKVQMDAMDIAKWYEGERRKSDPGQEYIIDWINRNAKEWREGWEKSCCQHCEHWFNCGHKLKINCSNFKFDNKEDEEVSE